MQLSIYYKNEDKVTHTTHSTHTRTTDLLSPSWAGALFYKKKLIMMIIIAVRSTRKILVPLAK